jgi:hypothetical protein
MKKFIKTYIFKSWKTTLAGISLAIIAYLQQTNKISTEAAASLTTLLISLGLVASKDANATGSTTPGADGRPDKKP